MPTGFRAPRVPVNTTVWKTYQVDGAELCRQLDIPVPDDAEVELSVNDDGAVEIIVRASSDD
jgi:hypothetical protein